MTVPYDRLVDKYFIRQDDGRVIFMVGRRGGGYWIDTPEREQSLRAAMQRRLKLWRIFLIVCFVPIFLQGIVSAPFRPLFWMALAAVWAVSLFWLFWSRNRLTRGLMPAPVASFVAGKRNADTWRDRTAARQSYFVLALQLALWPTLAIYALKDMASTGPSPSAVSAVLMAGVLLILAVVALYTKIRKGRALGGPSPEQLYSRSIWRPIWLVVIALFLVALVELFIQATHRAPTPTRQVSQPLVEANLTNP